MNYPIMCNLKGKKILIVGGGKVACRKIKGLLETGAYIFVVGKSIAPEIKELKNEYLNIDEKYFEESDLEGKNLVFTCTDEFEINNEVVRLSKLNGIMVSSADQAIESDFMLPAIYRNGDLVIAVSTSGANPTLSKQIRDEIKEQYSGDYRERIEILKELRKEVMSIADEKKRTSILKKIGCLDIDELRERRSNIED